MSYGYEDGYGSGNSTPTQPSTQYGYMNEYGSNGNDNSTSIVPSNAVQQIQNGVQQVASQPDIQPFNGINPFSQPQGGPVQQVLGSMRQVASLPLRYSATLGQASQPVADATAESLGKAGVNPYVSAAAAMIAGAASDPRSWTPTGGISMEHPNELPLDVAQAREARTGVPARKFQALYKDPGALFAGNNINQAGQDVGAAKEAAGISQGVQHGDLDSLNPENIQMVRSPRAAGREALNSILLKKAQNDGVIEGSGITPDELNLALADSNNRLSKLQPGSATFQQESAIKSNLQNILEQIAPDVKKANATYAREKLGQSFAPMNGVNKNGTPSKLGLMAQGGSAAIGALLGHLVPGVNSLEGAGVGAMVGKTANQLYHAPFVAGLQTAGSAVANRAIDPVITAIQQMSTSPQAQALVARYMQNQYGNQQ